jgi:hypothetical protein
MAMMGICEPLQRSATRSAAVASKPFNPGICTSIRIRSNLSRLHAVRAFPPAARQLQPLGVASHGQRLYDISETFADVELQGVEAQLSGLYFGKIESDTCDDFDPAETIAGRQRYGRRRKMTAKAEGR